jgi:hypothetical protein
MQQAVFGAYDPRHHGTSLQRLAQYALVYHHQIRTRVVGAQPRDKTLRGHGLVIAWDV